MNWTPPLITIDELDELNELWEAVDFGNIEKVRILISKKPHFLFSDNIDGHTLLLLAIKRDYTDISKFLLSQPRSSHIVNTVHRVRLTSPLILASCRGQHEIVYLLLEKGANVNYIIPTQSVQTSGGGASTIDILSCISHIDLSDIISSCDVDVFNLIYDAEYIGEQSVEYIEIEQQYRIKKMWMINQILQKNNAHQLILKNIYSFLYVIH